MPFKSSRAATSETLPNRLMPITAPSLPTQPARKPGARRTCRFEEAGLPFVVGIEEVAQGIR